MLLAEDLLPLLTDDGAGSGERVRPGRLVVRDPGPTGDGLLDEALAIVGQEEGKKP